MNVFDDPDAVASYAERPKRQVPGFSDMQRMAMLLLAERAADEARILVVGAGGGLELKVFAEGRPGWRFDGVDPSAEMLKLARLTLGPLIERVTLHEGEVDAAPDGPFDGASCLLVLHFLPEDARLRLLREIRRRLKPGAPLVVVHHSFPRPKAEAELWLSRYAAFAASSGTDPAQAANAAQTMAERLPALSPEQDEAMLREAGFSNVGLFYAAFTFRGWVAYA
ncbi:class I SAM-dependent methyltransferase [Chenggangzhangella methanolivorans]|uniref:Class I SAM-dependent methyltransferase n=2 Tax=Chenggangzhangella methanolivorans TaxID=1437009 RepID=A0A9E6RAP4_9HYPH|nr:class I SAM-dependent methyltransferase [Chenggangzhangella methanolivorans]QZO01298.1 class I SAM-dependent methyltransferase [Chenggangzhangella methanolivorans]